MKQVYLKVECLKNPDGTARPSVIHWKDGRKLPVERVLRTSMALNDEFVGVRYTILVGKREKYLYRDSSGWYVRLPA